ncbi:unnamed protein product [Mycena citricolor]|uniref:Rho-GAP domain-containing protein n=1 Tax=Mycena citricolor TaxID=2018698 RepID=A0AAD2H7F3_9AGAR|nr:unnamed protein product [Mycena citricolor]CAK5269658.1 unnamed protein product [Mycena citricolor]
MAADQAPTKANLKAWWAAFTSPQKIKEYNQDDTVHTVFGKPLRESLKYASVQISTANAQGNLYVWGYIPVVVAKCGLWLKENATEVPGTFRVNGSNKRMRELQALFETPPKYGKSLDWKNESYTTHDVASVFRRYLTQMPEPVIPHDMYHAVRDVLSQEPVNQDEVIATYKRLIRSMPRANQYLLLYVLDLLSVFARKSDKNLMTASSKLIFRPGLISHPEHEMSPPEHALSQRVLEFLIAQQDWFMVDVPPPPPNHDPSSPLTWDDDDDPIAVGGSWKVVGKASPPMARRKTTIDSTDSGRTVEASLSPVDEAVGDESANATVTRRRTLPPGRAGRINDAEGDVSLFQRPKVLRKQKRSSSSQPRGKDKDEE